MEKITVARPYAKAIFNIALSSQELTAWSDYLQILTQVIMDSRIATLIDHPSVAVNQKVTLLQEVCQAVLPKGGENVIQVLADNKRLLLLPEIAAVFEHLRRQYEKTIDVNVLSASALSDEQQQKLQTVLEKKLQRKVALNVELQKDLLGGMVIQAESLVIDGSVQGKLQRLHHAMLA